MHDAGISFLYNLSLSKGVNDCPSDTFLDFIESWWGRSLEVDPQTPVETINERDCEPGHDCVHEKVR